MGRSKDIKWEDSAVIGGVTLNVGDHALFEWPAKNHKLEGRVKQIGPVAVTLVLDNGKHHFVIRDRVDRVWSFGPKVR